MAKTLVGVVYDTRTLAVRRIVVPDDDGKLSLHAGPGESLATAPRSQGYSLERAFEIVRQKTGRSPPSLRETAAADKAQFDLRGR